MRKEKKIYEDERGEDKNEIKKGRGNIRKRKMMEKKKEKKEDKEKEKDKKKIGKKKRK